MHISDFEYSCDRYETWNEKCPELFYEEYIYSTNIDGQFVEVYFQCEEPVTHLNNFHWNIGLVIGTKVKKKEEYFAKEMVTGKIGLKGLLFAKAAIENFEKLLSVRKCNHKHYLYCSWLDNRRRNVYAYGLQKIGFNYGVFNKKKCLIKQVKQHSY